MNHNLEIQKILLTVNKTERVEDKITLLKEAIKIADVNNDINWGVDLRLKLLHNEIDTSGCHNSFPAFTWILNAHDNNPELINESDFLWEYKWMADEAVSNCNISLEQVDQILEDLRNRLIRNGYSDRSYYTILIFKHMFLGDWQAAHATLEKRDQSPRDRMTDNEAWEHNIRVLLPLKEGKFDEAIYKAQDILSGKLTSNGLPFATLSSLCYYLSKGNDPRAEKYARLADIEMAKETLTSSFICNVAQVIFSLYVIGEKAKAWQYFEETAEWFLTGSDFLRFDYLLFIMPLIHEKGTKTLNISHKMPYYKEDNIYNIQDLYNYYRPIAEEYAIKFDKRNRNNVFSQKLKAHTY